ncbi:unnamed protein product [Rotaria socialis]|uniref:GH84 domain-containing protein n=1 Tax=Rotaria socialis TaxID=392032 RepID=A0A818LNI5_9BILA|nr:unnamed protein product [Rotaria socialis]
MDTNIFTKYNQLSSFACEHWALLFHDIEYETCQKDHNIFISFAHAQVTLVNEIYDYLNKSNDVLLFCPTGPKVISRFIIISHILSVNTVLQRRSAMWDNLNANDYDQRRS